MGGIVRATAEWIKSLPIENGMIIVPTGEYESFDWSPFGRILFGYGCKFGGGCTFGDWFTFGGGCTFGDWCTFGDGCIFGGVCIWNKLKIDNIYTMSNIDGTGRQIKIAIGDCGTVRVEAGCFRGTDSEFVAKAQSDGRLKYVALVGAFCKALKEFKSGGES